MCLYVEIYACTYTSIIHPCVHPSTNPPIHQACRQEDRQTDRQADRQNDTPTHTQTYQHTHHNQHAHTHTHTPEKWPNLPVSSTLVVHRNLSVPSRPCDPRLARFLAWPGCHVSCRYVKRASSPDMTFQGCGLRWAMHTKGIIALIVHIELQSPAAVRNNCEMRSKGP